MSDGMSGELGGDLGEETSAEALRRNEERFRAYVDASSDVVYRMNADWSEMRQWDGEGFMADQKPGRDWMDGYIYPEDQPELLAAIRDAIRTKSIFELEHRVRRADGSLGWTLSRAIPVLDGDGEIVEWIGAASDVTARRRALDDLARVTAEAEQQRHFYDALISSTPDLVYAFDRNYRFLFANRALLAMWDRTLEDSVGKSLVEIGYEPWHAEMHEREIDQVIATKQPIRGEVGFPHATLGWRIYDYIFTPVLDSAGEVDWIAGTTRDITDRKRTEEHLQLLIHELNHRVKNTLATIQSIAAQTFRGESDQAARAAFDSRLIALSEAHTILTRTNWEGAELKDIAERALAAFQSEGHYPERVRIDGCEVQLRPQVALALAMAFHELASNAAKYGALSTVSGSIRLHWEREDDRLRITWKEAGGPPVATPSHRGFGTRLIEQGLARELKGEVRLDYQPDGVVCTIDIPLPSERRQDESS